MYRTSVFVLLAAACLARVVFLDMDPHYYQWGGYVTDEGRWTEQARAVAQTGTLDTDDLLHLLLAPLYQVLSLASFEAFGVSLTTARLTSALSGCALLIGMFFLLRRFVSPTATLVALSLVAFHADYVMLSRLAIPEMPAMFGSLVAFAILVSDWPRRSRLLATGVVLGATVATKATTLPLLGIFAVIAYFDRRQDRGIAKRLRHAIWLLAPIATGASVALAVAIALRWSEAAGFFAIMRHFLGVRPLYDAIDVLYSSAIAPVLCVAALGAWVGVVGLIAARPDAADPRRRLAEAAGWWSGLYLLLMLVQAYFPDRYIAHILTPLTLLTAAGIDVLLERGLTGLPAALARGARGRGLPAIALLGFPTAVLTAPIAVGAVVSMGVELRLRLVMLAIAVVWIVVSGVIFRWRDQQALLRGVVVVPIVAAGLWFAGWAVSETHFVFWPDGTEGSMAVTGRMAVMLGVAVCIATIGRGTPRSRALAVAAGSIAIWTLHLAPAYLDRHYSMRDTSRDLAERFGDYRVAEYASEGLFLDNEIPFQRLEDGWHDRPLPELIVVTFRFGGGGDFMRIHYEPIAHYDLYFSARYRSRPAVRWAYNCCTVAGRTVTVYRLRDLGGGEV